MIFPLLHRILVKAEKFEDVNKDIQRAKSFGLVIPELEDMKRAQASVDVGVVVAIGPTAYRDFNTDVPVAIGERVNYARFAGKLIRDPETDEEYVCLNDEDIICVIRGDK